MPSTTDTTEFEIEDPSPDENGTDISTNNYRRNHWGKLQQFPIPLDIFRSDKLILKPAPLSALLVLFERAKARTGVRKIKQLTTVDVDLPIKDLIDCSGYSENIVAGAIKDLEAKKFLRNNPRRDGDGTFGVNVYTLCNPVTGIPLTSTGSNVLYSNDVRYITMPTCLVKDHTERWSLANIDGSSLRLYQSICYLVNRNQDGRPYVEVNYSQLKKLSTLSTMKLVKDSVDALEKLALITVYGNAGGVEVWLNNPRTGEQLQAQDDDPTNDPVNYYVEGSRRGNQWNVNTGTATDVIRLLTDCGLHSLQEHESGNWSTMCPYHDDRNPSFFVHPLKRTFYCHGCSVRGHLSDLVMHLQRVDKGAAYKLIAEATGQNIEYHDPDTKAEAIYSYRNRQGKLLKQVLRYPGKKFRQRKPAGGGTWKWDVKRVKPTLYNLQHFSLASVVCICEGEKDCDAIMGQKLWGSTGTEVVATTSGGVESWNDHLADELIGKRVVVMPDADEAGQRYRDEVIASLESRKIEYRVVEFTGTGAKDVSAFLQQGGTRDELVQRIGSDWVRTTEYEVRRQIGSLADI